LEVSNPPWAFEHHCPLRVGSASSQARTIGPIEVGRIMDSKAAKLEAVKKIESGFRREMRGRSVFPSVRRNFPYQTSYQIAENKKAAQGGFF
jgi:hypothetical protein